MYSVEWVIKNMKAIFMEICPNCGNEITDERLLLGLPCDKCLKNNIEKYLMLRKKLDMSIKYRRILVKELSKNERLINYREIYKLELASENFSKFFKKMLNNRPWTAQLTWAKRVFRNKSFAILAPTGVGKTVFGIIMALFLASKYGKKCYIILPTTLLVKQVVDKMNTFNEILGQHKVKIIYYSSDIPIRQRREISEKIQKKEYDILITTSHFLSRSFKKLVDQRFDFIFVDDVDSLLKTSKNIDRVLRLLGFTSEIIDTAMQLLYTKRMFASYLSRKRQPPPELIDEISSDERKIQKFIRKNKIGILVVSTATGRVRGIRSKLFRELLGFEIGSRAGFLRNIQDLYIYTPSEKKIFSLIANIVKRLGKGGLIFVPIDRGIDYAKSLCTFLKNEGVRAGVVYAGRKKALNEFIEGSLDVLIGVAIYYGLLVRGLDLPEKVRYALFTGVPRFVFSLEIPEAANPIRLLQIAFNIRDYLPPQYLEELDRITLRLKTRISGLSQAALQRLFISIKEGTELMGSLAIVRDEVFKLRDFLQKMLSDKSVIDNLKKSRFLSVREIDGKLYIYIPDTMTYLQASGRTSRMYAGGITKGLSIVIVDDEKLLSGLIRQTKWYIDDIDWRNYMDVNIDEILNEIDKDRENVKAILKGESSKVVKEPIKTALLIVESPNKARTISNFYGKPSKRRIGNIVIYEVGTENYLLNIVATSGHIYDLVTKRGFHGVEVLDSSFIPVYMPIKKCLRCGTQYTDHGACPVCKSKEYISRKEVIEALKNIAQEVDIVLLGTDPDTEGEKIAWDLLLSLSPYSKQIKRIEFHEITRKAVSNALKEPRDINEKLVFSQLVRRIEDRWIGFVLSQKLWKVFGSRWLSAGRVQTPVLNWIVSRVEEFKDKRMYAFKVALSNGKIILFDNLPIKSRSEAKKIKQSILDKKCVISQVSKEIVVLNPPPPFSTDLLLEEGVKTLRIGVDEIMKLAQDLFELGLITYHRTDSTRVSDAGRRIALEYISQQLDKSLFMAREWGKGGAHECIRPTRPINMSMLRRLINEGIIRTVKPLTKKHYMLYDLIFNRFIASQLPPAKIVKSKYKISIDKYLEKEIEGFSHVVEYGFTRVYFPYTMLDIKEGVYDIIDVKYRKIATVRLYTQADIIRLMKERGLGRPSTYAKIVKTLIERRYVLESKNKRIVPTRRGRIILNYLKKNYGELVSEERSRIVEEKMKEIERGKLNYLDVLKEFYNEVKSIQ